MAYSRGRRSAYGARSRVSRFARKPRAGYGRSAPRRLTGRRTASRRAAPQTVRIVLETAPISAVSRNPLAPLIETKRGKAKL